jgi:hypothetical protein
MGSFGVGLGLNTPGWRRRGQCEDRGIATNHQREAALQAYYDKVKEQSCPMVKSTILPSTPISPGFGRKLGVDDAWPQLGG